MPTSLPTFQNATSRTLAAPRYNFSDVPVPPGKYITGEYYAEENTLDGEPTGIYLYEVLGFTDVSSGDDPLPADIVYDYVVPTPSGGGTPGGTIGQLQYNDDGEFGGLPGSSIAPLRVEVSIADAGRTAGLSLIDGNGLFTASDGTDTSTLAVAPASAALTRVSGTGKTTMLLVDDNEAALTSWWVDPPYSKVYAGPAEAGGIANDGVGNEASVVLTPTTISLRAIAVLVSSLPVYADNAAAFAGGLVVDQLYKTAAGDLKIVY